MSDIVIFGMGLFVSLVVACAVGLLLWGAAHEPRGPALFANKPDPAPPQARPSLPVSESAPSLESRSLA